MTWWTTLNGLQQTLWVLSLLSTTFFTVSTLLSFVGVGDMDFDVDVDMDVDMDVNADADLAAFESSGYGAEVLEYLSLRNIAAFTLGFSWTGILFYESLGTLALLIAVPAGAGFAYLNQWLTKMMLRLESSGNVNLQETLGHSARVSVEVDAARAGKGKVIVRLLERELELLAITEDTQALKRGQRVQIYNVEDGVLWVSKEDRLGLGDIRGLELERS